MILNTTYEGEMGEEYKLKIEFGFTDDNLVYEWIEIERPNIYGDLVWEDFYDNVMADEKLEARLELECIDCHEEEVEGMLWDAADMAYNDKKEAEHDAEMSRDTGANDYRHY